MAVNLGGSIGVGVGEERLVASWEAVGSCVAGAPAEDCVERGAAGVDLEGDAEGYEGDDSGFGDGRGYGWGVCLVLARLWHKGAGRWKALTHADDVALDLVSEGEITGDGDQDVD